MTNLFVIILLIFDYKLILILNAVGDFTYGTDKELENKAERMMLHAHTLKYVLEITY